MTADQLFNKIKNKRIKWHAWDDDHYIILKKLLFQSGDIFCARTEDFYNKTMTLHDYYFTIGEFINKKWIVLDKDRVKTHLPEFL